MANFQHCIISPADYHFAGDRVYIDYYYADANGRRCRKCIRCNRLVDRLHTRREKIRFLRAYCASINTRLLLPEAFLTAPAVTEKVTAVEHNLHQYAREFIEKKSKTLRPASLRTYKTVYNKVMKNTSERETLESFSREKASLLLDAIEGPLGARGYNNNLKLARTMWAWFIERGYIDRNPFALIRPRKTDRKKRTIISQEDARRMMQWCSERRPYLETVLLLIHSALIRPKEVGLIRCSDVDLENHTIRIRCDVAKNHHERLASMTPQCEQYIRRLLANSHHAEDYLISKENRPSPEAIAEKRFLKDFYVMKDELGLPDNYQLYSLRDTGITNLIKAGLDDITVMRHADHSSLKITSMYARHEEISVCREIWTSGVEL